MGGCRSGIVAALMALAVLASSFAWAPSQLPRLPLCWFRSATGLPCAGCGLTHSLCAVSHGDFAAAWAYNPFGYVAYAALLALIAWPALAKASPALRQRLRHWRGWFPLVLLVSGAMIVFGVCRILGQLHAGAQLDTRTTIKSRRDGRE